VNRADLDTLLTGHRSRRYLAHGGHALVTLADSREASEYLDLLALWVAAIPGHLSPVHRQRLHILALELFRLAEG